MARLSELGLHPDADQEDMEEIHNYRLGLLGIAEQIEATISDKRKT